jgi:hypothetical protein
MQFLALNLVPGAKLGHFDQNSMNGPDIQAPIKMHCVVLEERLFCIHTDVIISDQILCKSVSAVFMWFNAFHFLSKTVFSTAFELRGGSTLFFMQGKTFFEQNEFLRKMFFCKKRYVIEVLLNLGAV